jgi:hypothetical protein
VASSSTSPTCRAAGTEGETRAEALAQAEDLLDEKILQRMADNEDVSGPLPEEAPIFYNRTSRYDLLTPK